MLFLNVFIFKLKSMVKDLLLLVCLWPHVEINLKRLGQGRSKLCQYYYPVLCAGCQSNPSSWNILKMNNKEQNVIKTSNSIFFLWHNYIFFTIIWTNIFIFKKSTKFRALSSGRHCHQDWHELENCSLLSLYHPAEG